MDFTLFNGGLFFVGFFATVVVYFVVETVKQRRKPKKLKDGKRKKGKAQASRAPEKAAPPIPREEERPQSTAGIGTGFRDLRWGQPMPDGMKAGEPDENDVTTCERAGDELLLGAAALESIRYEFWRGMLSSVVLTVVPQSLGRAVSELNLAYGPPAQKPGEARLSWPATPGAETITYAVLDPDTEKQAGTITISSKTIADMRRKAQK